MKKGYIYFLLVMLMAACSSEENPTDNPPPGTRSNSDVTIRINFPTADSPATRAISASDENKITSVDLLVFTDDGNSNMLDDKYAYKIHIASADISDHASATDGNVKTFHVDLKNMPSDKQRILLLANIPDALRTSVIDALGDSDIGVATEQSIISRLRFHGAPWRTALTSGNHTPFPMFGQMTNYINIDHDHQITSPITINMIRSVARIDVKVDASSVDFGQGTGFSINKIYLCNASDSGYVAPHSDYISHAPELTTIGKTNPAYTRVASTEYTFPPLSNRELSRSIYVPESDSLIVNGTDSIKPAFLVIDAQYKGQQRFYRIDFTKGATFIPLLRNHNYVINILNIKADGYTSLAAAMNAPLTTLNFSVSIEGANSDINDITTYNDQYLLGLSVNEVIFDWDQNWIGKPATGGQTAFPVRVFSTYNNGEWSVASAPAGFTAQKQSPTELSITASNKNYTGEELAPVKVTLRAGFITKDITVRQTGGANSAVAKFASSATTATVRIPLGLVAAAKPGVFNGKAISVFRDSVLWQEAGTGVTFNTSLTNGSTVSQQYITVTATVPNSASNKYANAVIALTWKNEGGLGMVGGEEPYEVVWSWHIWAMPETGAAGYSSGGDVNGDFHNPNLPLLMKRVLGKGVATHQGLHYQWGRKDPFFRELSGISPAIFHSTDVVLTGNKENAILHPSTFYKGTAASVYDWIGTAHDNTLWSASPTPATKTFYDPCPEGWRVPPQYTNVATSPWQNDVNIVRAEYSNGRISSGNVAGTATGGYVWTATTNVNQSYYTTIPAAGTITHNVAAERASGLSVRCVKDLERKY